MSSYGAIRRQEGFCRYSCYWLVFTFKRVKAAPSCQSYLTCHRWGSVLQRHRTDVYHVVWNHTPPHTHKPTHAESGMETLPTGFHDAQIKGREHSQDLIKTEKSFCRFAYLFMKCLWNIYKRFPDIYLKIHFRASLVWERGRWKIRECAYRWKKEQKWTLLLSMAVKGKCQGNECVTRGCPKNQAAACLHRTGDPTCWDLLSRSHGNHKCSV